MEFALTEEEEAVREAASGLFDGLITVERLQAVESSTDRFDRELWAALGRSELLGVALPEADGGGDLGMVALCLLLEAQGRRVAQVPLWSTLAAAALPIAKFGSIQQKQRWLPGVSGGTVVLTAALTEVAVSAGIAGVGASLVPGAASTDTTANWPIIPSVQAVPDPGVGPGAFRLTGYSAAVPWAHVADQILVPAATPGGGIILALVDPDATGLSQVRAETTNREIHCHLKFDGVPVSVEALLGGGNPGNGAAMVRSILDGVWTGISALALGVAESALAQTSDYLNQREQFGRPLSTFQGTMLRAADAAIDTAAMRATLWQAAWRLDTQRPASEAVAVAVWWASDAGQRVVHATQHLHGGMGADVDYPIHRYFLWNKQIELLLGGPSAQLARLGDMVAVAFDAEHGTSSRHRIDAESGALTGVGIHAGVAESR